MNEEDYDYRPGCFAVGDTVKIPVDLVGVIRQVDRVNRKILIEFTGGESDGAEEWWPMSSFDQIDN